ncbi:hypothetical protein DINM_004747 [Dirofilaria immitis]|nr:hypothetical protein [Dirofilaria immitis]
MIYLKELWTINAGVVLSIFSTNASSQYSPIGCLCPFRGSGLQSTASRAAWKGWKQRTKGMPENSGHQEKQGSFKLPGQPGGVGVVGRRGLRGPQGDQSTKEI